MKLRKATMQDAKALFDWRNDPETRRASHSTGELSFDSHMSWLKASLENPMRRLLVAEEAGTAVGIVRVDQGQGRIAELSWTVAPEARGRGVAKRMVQMVAKEVAATQSIRAEVKEANMASAGVAEAAGMKLLRNEGGVLYFFLESAAKKSNL